MYGALACARRPVTRTPGSHAKHPLDTAFLAPPPGHGLSCTLSLRLRFQTYARVSFLPPFPDLRAGSSAGKSSAYAMLSNEADMEAWRASTGGTLKEKLDEMSEKQLVEFLEV